jgi:hypothetical protein
MYRFLKIETDSHPSAFGIRVNSLFFEKVSKILNIEKFVNCDIIDKQSLITCFEKIIIELSDLLKYRLEPESPNLLYLPLEQMYIEVTIFEKKYRLLQGNDSDNEILLLFRLKNLLQHAILNGEVLSIKFCDNLGV